MRHAKVFEAKKMKLAKSIELRECQMKFSSVRLFERCLMVNFGTQHAPKHRWVHFWPLVHAVNTQRKSKRAKEPIQLTFDQEFLD